MSYTERNPYTARIEALEDEVETWRCRAEAAEMALRGGSEGEWVIRIAPLSLYQTRLMRLLSKRPMRTAAIIAALQADYPRTSDNSVKAHMSNIRRLLPPSIAPTLGIPCPGSMHFYGVPDRNALAEFLATGVLPSEGTLKINRRAA